MLSQRTHEIEQNFLAFQGVVGTLVEEHKGEFALMRSGKVVEVYDDLVNAVVAGHSGYSDGIFSIQEVAIEPLDLGFFSHAHPLG